MNKIKAVIFDIDGTLGNMIPLCIEAFRQTVEPLVHHSLSDEEIEAAFGPNEAGTIKDLAPGSDYNKAVPVFLRHYQELHNMCPHAFDGIISLLNMLKNKSVFLAIASGKGKESTDISLKRFGINSFFRVIKNGSLDGKQKPGDIDSIIASAGITKEETIYVGDSPSDIKDSRKAGVSVVAAAWAPTAKAEELVKEAPDEMFYTVQEFSDWLLGRV